MKNESHGENLSIPQMGNIWKRSKSYQKQKKFAQDVAREALKKHKKPYLAISGGLDSVALAAIVLPVAKELDVQVDLWLHASDASFPGTRATVKEVASWYDARLTIDESPVSAFDVVGKQSSAFCGKKGFFFDAIESFVTNGNYDLVFLGTRAAESTRRGNAAMAHGPVYHSTVPVPHTKCEPLIWMSFNDVAAVVMEYGLPIHPIYSKKKIGRGRIRLGYATSLDLLSKGSAVFLKHNYPDLYRKISAVYPEIRKYV